MGSCRLPEVEGDKPKKKLKRYRIVYFHIDIAEVRTSEGKIRLLVAIDRTSKFAYVELYERAGKMVAAQFLRNLIMVVPDKIHTVLTDNHRPAGDCEAICREGASSSPIANRINMRWSG